MPKANSQPSSPVQVLLCHAERGRRQAGSPLLHAYYSHGDFLKHFPFRLLKESSQISQALVPDPEMEYKNK